MKKWKNSKTELFKKYNDNFNIYNIQQLEIEPNCLNAEYLNRIWNTFCIVGELFNRYGGCGSC